MTAMASEMAEQPAVIGALLDRRHELAARLREIGGIRILTRGNDGATVALFENKYRLQRLLTDEPELTLTPLSVDL